MNCSSCGTRLPEGAGYCPTCGAITAYEVSRSDSSPYDLTSASSSYGASAQVPPTPTDYGSFPSDTPAPPPPPTAYGTPPYGMPLQNPYAQANPYEVPLQPSPPPPSLSPKRQFRTGIIIGIVALVLVLVAASIFVLLGSLTKHNSTAASTPSPATAQTGSASTATALALTPTGATTPYSPYTGTVALNDPLRDNSNGYNWQQVSNSNGSCAFTGGGYHVKTLTGGYFFPCVAQNTDFANFIYEVQMQIIQGDCGAILFRVDPTTTSFYFFRLCQGGTYALFLYRQNNGSSLLNAQSTPAINAGLNQTNLIAVVAQGSTIELYINHQNVGSISDSTFSHGRIAVLADGFPHNHPTEVAYSNAKVWKL